MPLSINRRRTFRPRFNSTEKLCQRDYINIYSPQSSCLHTVIVQANDENNTSLSMFSAVPEKVNIIIYRNYEVNTPNVGIKLWYFLVHSSEQYLSRITIG